MSIMNRLINQETGEIDGRACIEATAHRAAHVWGDTNYPDSILFAAQEFVLDRARGMRTQWRVARGLPDDSPVTMTEVADWGSSGDSYGRG